MQSVRWSYAKSCHGESLHPLSNSISNVLPFGHFLLSLKLLINGSSLWASNLTIKQSAHSFFISVFIYFRCSAYSYNHSPIYSQIPVSLLLFPTHLSKPPLYLTPTPCLFSPGILTGKCGGRKTHNCPVGCIHINSMTVNLMEAFCGPLLFSCSAKWASHPGFPPPLISIFLRESWIRQETVPQSSLHWIWSGTSVCTHELCPSSFHWRTAWSFQRQIAYCY